MSQRFALPVVVLLVLLAVPAGASAAPACRAGRAEVRFDDGRLLVTRAARAVNPRTVSEHWSACWRPTGARRSLAVLRHGRSTSGLSVAAVGRGRFVALQGDGSIRVYDGRAGRLTAAVPQTGVVRELVITERGYVAALEDQGAGSRLLYGGAGARRCLLDAGSPQPAGGNAFGDLSVRREHVAWYRDGVQFGQELTRLDC